METTLYRNDSYFGSGVRNLRDIIEYEMSELRNWDIPEYILGHYKLNRSLRKKLKGLVEQHDNYDYPFVGGVDCRSDIHDLIEEIIAAVSAQTGIGCVYGLWLAGLDDVRTLYSTSDEDTIDCYRITEAVFSDLGPDGKLFGYAVLPEKYTET